MAELVVKPNEKIEPLPTYLGSSIRFIAAIALIARFQHESSVPSKNRRVKDRINCVNAVLLNYRGERRMALNPRCKELAKDFEQVAWKADPHGNPLSDINKSDPMRTHLSDALGYYVVREFPLRPKTGERGGLERGAQGAELAAVFHRRPAVARPTDV